MHGNRGIDIVAGHDATGLGTFLAQQPRELARVETCDGNDPPALKIGRQGQVGTPVAFKQWQVTDHQARRRHHGGLLVLGGRAGVSDVRIGQRNDLTGVRRIGEDLLIACHGRIEDNFAGRITFCSDRTAMEYGSICQSQYGAHTHSPTSACRLAMASSSHCCDFRGADAQSGRSSCGTPSRLARTNPQLDVTDSGEILRFRPVSVHANFDRKTCSSSWTFPAVYVATYCLGNRKSAIA